MAETVTNVFDTVSHFASSIRPSLSRRPHLLPRADALGPRPAPLSSPSPLRTKRSHCRACISSSPPRKKTRRWVPSRLSPCGCRVALSSSKTLPRSNVRQRIRPSATDWWVDTIRLRGSTVPRVWRAVTICTLWSAVVAVADLTYGKKVSFRPPPSRDREVGRDADQRRSIEGEWFSLG